MANRHFAMGVAYVGMWLSTVLSGFNAGAFAMLMDYGDSEEVLAVLSLLASFLFQVLYVFFEEALRIFRFAHREGKSDVGGFLGHELDWLSALKRRWIFFMIYPALVITEIQQSQRSWLDDALWYVLHVVIVWLVLCFMIQLVTRRKRRSVK